MICNPPGAVPADIENVESLGKRKSSLINGYSLSSSEFGQHGLSARDLFNNYQLIVLRVVAISIFDTHRYVSSRFIFSVDNLPMINDHSVSASPLTSCPANGLRELGLIVCQEKLLQSKLMPEVHESNGKAVYNIVSLDAIGLAPSTHDERVVESNDCYNIDTFRFDFG